MPPIYHPLLEGHYPLEPPLQVLLGAHREGPLVYEEYFRPAGGLQGRELSTQITEFTSVEAAEQFLAEKLQEARAH